MSLTRVFTTIGSVLVRKLGDAGGPPSGRVSQELDNIIAWAKDAPRNIKRDTSTVGNVGIGLSTLHTFSLDTPNRLTANNDYLNVWYGGTFAATTNTKQVQAKFGGIVYENMGLFDLRAAVGWALHAKIIRLSSTSVLVSHILSCNDVTADSANVVNTFAAGGFFVARNTIITGLSDLGANATTMAVQGGTSAAVNNDVVQNLSLIELCQQ